jgi:hypothetical protein
MFKHDQPLARDLAIAVGNAYRPIDEVTLLIDARDMLNAVTESKMAIYCDPQTGDGNFRLTVRIVYKNTHLVKYLRQVCKGLFLFNYLPISGRG